jgi:hypothetical protein
MANDNLLWLAVLVAAPGLLTLTPEVVCEALRALTRRVRRRSLARLYTNLR